jgi:hypothetical protein
MLRSAATPYPERSYRMNQNQIEILYRNPMVCGPKKLCTLLHPPTEL